MKRFVMIAVVAVAVGLLASEKASAQIVYSYTAPVRGGAAAGNAYTGSSGTSYFSTYYSPYSGSMWGRTRYTISFGQAYGRSYRTTAVRGVMSQNTGFFMPGLSFNPYNGGSLGLNMFPGFGTGNTYRFYGYNPGAYMGSSGVWPDVWIHGQPDVWVRRLLGTPLVVAAKKSTDRMGRGIHPAALLNSRSRNTLATLGFTLRP